MRSPNCAPWMKQWHDFLGVGISTGEIGAFVTVAAVACLSKIFEERLSSMLTSKDVLEMEGLERRQVVRQVAVFAAPARTLADLLSKCLAHLIRGRIGSAAQPSGAALR